MIILAGIFGLGLPEIFILIFYFIPSFTASVKKHPYTTGVFILNIFLGWTIIGWVGALVWAVSVKNKSET
jgi:hypothetical protein